MCGIVGGIAVKPFDWLDDPDRLDAAIDTLKRRGPDDRGKLVTQDHRAFLGHRRLSIIDLAGGRQPISDESGRRHLCYNGEIYNHRALRSALEQRGHVMRTRVDGEVALHLYEEDAGAFVDDLDGMFAIAILDEPEQTLTLARDRNGIKPLYYYAGDDRLIFASEIKAILPLLPARPEMSSLGLREYLRWKYIPAPLTIFKDIHKLPPAHLLCAKRDGKNGRLVINVSSYWQLNYSGRKLSNEREALKRLDEELRASVKSHLEADVEVGALLSGGVDSSLVVALASEMSGRRIKTFSVGFEDVGFDQLPFARVLAERYGTEHREEHVALDPMNTVAELVRQFDEPFADSSALACYRVCQVAAEHVKVVLTGDGGDESFAGYRRYEEVLNPVPVTPWQRITSRAILASSGALFSPEAKYLKRFEVVLDSPLRRHEQHLVLCSPWLMNKLLTEAHRPAVSDLDVFAEHRQLALRNGWSPIDVAQFVDLSMYLPGDILTKVDRTSMACSLECRVPLLDHRITEFSATLSPELKIRRGVRKYLLKRLAERYVPRELLYRKKMGFRVPIRRWFKRDLLDQTTDLLLDGALVARNVLDPNGLRWMLKNQRRPWIDFGSQLWALLFLETWSRTYFS